MAEALFPTIFRAHNDYMLWDILFLVLYILSNSLLTPFHDNMDIPLFSYHNYIKYTTSIITIYRNQIFSTCHLPHLYT